MAAGPPQQLEALYVDVSVNDDPFDKSAQALEQKLDALEKKFISFGQNISLAFNVGTQDAARALANIGKFIDSAIALPAVNKITRLNKPLGEFADGFNEVAKKMDGAAPAAAAALGKVGSFMSAATNFKLDDKQALATRKGLSVLMDGLLDDVAQASQASPAVDAAVKSLGRLGMFMNAATRFDPSKLTAQTQPLKQYFADIAGLDSGHVDRADVVGLVIGRMARSLNRLSTSPVGGAKIASTLIPDILSNLAGGVGGNNVPAINATAKLISHMATSLGELQAKTFAIDQSVKSTGNVKTIMSNLAAGISSTPAISDSANVLDKMTGSVDRFNKVNVAGMQNATGQMVNAMSALNKMTVGAGVPAALKALNQFANVAKKLGIAGAMPAGTTTTTPGINASITGTFNTTGSGGTTPPVTRALNTVPPAARSAQSSINDLGREMRSFSSAGDRLVAALTSVHMAMVTIGTFSLRQFANADDAITRAYANMMSREGTEGFEQTSRPQVQASLYDLSGKTRTGAVELAKGFDQLSRAGMSAGMALEAVQFAESFALASGMKMEEGTRRLVDIQRNFGLNTTNVAKHLQNMVDISDILAGTALRTGSTVDELSQAMTAKLGIAAKTMNMDLNTTVAVLGTFSEQGFRGANAGNMLSQTINKIGTKRAGEGFKWAELLGSDIYDAEGKLVHFADLADKITARMGNNPQEMFAKFGYLKLDKTVIPAMAALINQGDNIRKKMKDMEGFTGIAEKMADMMRRSFMGQMTTLYNVALNTASVVGERLAPALFLITEPLRIAAEWFQKLNPAIQSFAIGAVVAGLAAYPLLSTLRYIVGMPFRMIGSAIGGVFSFVSSIASGIGSAFQAVYSGASHVVSVLGTVGNALFQSVMLPVRASYLLFATLYRVGEFTADIVTKIGNVTTTLITEFIKAGLMMAVGLLSSIVSIAAALVALPIVVFVATAAFAVLGAAMSAVAVTVGIGLAQLGVALGGAVVALWIGFKAAVAGAFAWMSDRMQVMHEGVVGIWGSFKDSAVKAFQAIGDVLHKLAGFFWNFKQNLGIISEWWKINWEAAVADIGNFAVAVIENLSDNIYKILAAVGISIGMVFGAIGGRIVKVFDTVQHWLHFNWSRMWEDAGTIFKTFVKNIVENFFTLLPVVNAIANYIGNRFMESMFPVHLLPIPPSEKKDREAIHKAMGDLSKADLRGPFDNMPELKTKGNNLASSLYTQGSAFIETLGNLGGKMGGVFGDLLDDLSPLTRGFKALAPWADLMASLNLELPKNAIDSLASLFGGPTRPPIGESGGGDMFAKGGPGYTFKQISMERFEAGGEYNQRLDYQQLVTLQAIRKDIGFMADAMKEKQPNFVGPRRPMKEGGD